MKYFNTQMSQTTKNTAKQALRGIAAIVFVVAIVWVAMQSFRVLPSVRHFFANAFVSVESFFSPAERITVSITDSQVVVDEPFMLTWQHRGKSHDGSYTMSYACNDNVHLARTSGTGDSTLFCNTDIPLLADETTLNLVAHGDVDGVEQIVFSVRFSPNGSSVVSEEGQVTISVQDTRFDTATSTSTTGGTSATSSDATSTPATSSTGGTHTGGGYTAGTPTYTTVPVVTQPYSDPKGKADLRIRILAIGLVDKSSGKFTQEDEIPRDLPSGKRGAIKFEIENIGTKKADKGWNFDAKLPTSPAYTYTSPSQPELYPEDRVEYVIGFDKLVNKDEASYTITVDPKNEIKESNEDNNKVTKTIDIDR